MDAQRFAKLKALLQAAESLDDEGRQQLLNGQELDADPELRELARTILDKETRSLDLREVIDAAAPIADGDSQSSADAPPENIGPYRILEELGSGGMARVYRAEQEQPFRREVAVKLIQGSMEGRRVLERVRQERRTLALMEHPNIANILDAGTTDAGQPYLVMELVRGIPITDYCRSRRLDLPARLKLLGAVSRAVQHAHQKGVIHRDLKPSNILVSDGDKGPVAKVIDFGVAKIIDADGAALTRDGQVIGTPVYMSPEQARGEHDKLDIRSDIYGLGVILFELVTDTLPYDLKSNAVLDVIRAVDQGPVRKLRSTPSPFNPIDDDLEVIVDKTMARDPELRYSSAGDVADDLDRYLRQEPISARPPSTTYLMRRLVARHRLPFGLAAGSLVVLVLLTILLAIQLQVSERERRVAEYETSRAIEFTTIFNRSMILADATGTDKSEIRLREVLDSIAKSIANEPSTDASTQGHLLGILGHMYYKIDLHEEAESHLTRSIELSRAAEGPSALDSAIPLSVLGYMRLLNGDVAAADSLCSQAIEILAGAAGENNPDLANVLNTMIRIRIQQERYAEAQSLAARHLEIQRVNLEDNHRDLASAYQLLSWTQNLGGQPDVAIENMHSALGVMERGYPGDEGYKSYIVSLLSRQLAKAGKFAEAESLSTVSLGMYTRLYGEDHFFVARGLENLARLHLKMERFDEAKQGLESALRILTELPGDNRRESIGVESSLGNALLALDETGPAQSHLSRAVELCRQVGRKETLIGLLVDLGDAATENRQPQLAASSYREALDVITAGDAKSPALADRANAGLAGLRSDARSSR